MNKILHEIEKTNSLCPQGILIAEHDIIEHILLPKGFSTLTSLTFGKTIVDIIQKINHSRQILWKSHPL